VAPAGRPRTPSGRELQSLLEQGIAGLGQLKTAPVSDAIPRRVTGGPTLPNTASTNFRGRDALQRAREIRDIVRRRGAPVDPLVAELFDLLDRIGSAAE
jgi:hypothetical protein